MEEEDLQEAPGYGGGLQRPGEEPSGVSAADLAGAGERFDPRKLGVDGGLRSLHSGLRHREAGAQAERCLLRVRVEMKWGGLVRGCSASAGSRRLCEAWVLLC